MLNLKLKARFQNALFILLHPIRSLEFIQKNDLIFITDQIRSFLTLFLKLVIKL